MNALYRNSEAPFALLPYTVRRDLINYVVWSTAIGNELRMDFESENLLRTLNFDNLARWQAAMEKHRGANPHLYRGGGARIFAPVPRR